MPDAGDRVRAPRILNPHSVPVVGDDGHLKPVPADRLFAWGLRERFQQAAGWQAVLPGDGGAFGTRAPAAASVLVPLVQREQGLQVLLTQRTAHLRDHAGQISFPGGRAELEDADAVATALREAKEEVGLQAQQLEVLGCLPPYTTVTNFVVTPVVALVQPPLALRLDTFEVAQAFEVPLAHVMNPAHHQRHLFEHDGGQRQFLSMPYGEFFIWGATAAMLRNLYHFLAE